MKYEVKSQLKPLLLLCIIMILTILPLAAETDSSKTLRMALLPIPDALPSYVAEANGYFKEYGIVVEALSVGSALERDQLMQADRIDGMVNEIAGTASFNRDKIRMQIVASARKPISSSPLFRILTSPQSNITRVSQLKNIPIAVSKNTIIEYITDRLLTHEGLSMDEISIKSVPVLPERMQLLLSGQIQAATLPDPLGASALKAGAKVVIDDLKMPNHSVSVLSFHVKTLKNKKEAVKLYIKAWMRAAEELNNNPESYRALMLKKNRVPGNVRDSFKIPPFPVNEIPTEEQWNDVINWMIQKNLLKETVTFRESVNHTIL